MNLSNWMVSERTNEKKRKKWNKKIKSKIIVGGNKKKFHLEKLMLFIFGIECMYQGGNEKYLILANKKGEQWEMKEKKKELVMLCMHRTKNTGETRPKGINRKFYPSRKSRAEKLIKFLSGSSWWVLYAASHTIQVIFGSFSWAVCTFVHKCTKIYKWMNEKITPPSPSPHKQKIKREKRDNVQRFA